MKKVISFIMCFLLLMPMISVPAGAYAEKQVFEDGSYIKVFYDEGESGAEIEESSTVSFFKHIINIIKYIISVLFGSDNKEEAQTGPKSVSKAKYAEYYDRNGKLLWTVYLRGYFYYDGQKAECKNVAVSSSVEDSDWEVIKAEGSKSGATATGSFTVRQHKLGVPLKTIEKILTLTCEENGNIQ